MLEVTHPGDIQVASIQAGGVVEPAKRIERSSADFTDGVCCGYLYYFDQYAGKVLTDGDIHSILENYLKDPRYSKLYNAGWCVGLIEAVIEDHDLFAG